MENKFYLNFTDNWFEEGDIINGLRHSTHIKVIEKPYRKWYEQILQFITFGIYKPPWQYKCELITK